MKPIIYPVRVGINGLSIKDYTGRTIVSAPQRLDWTTEERDQWKNDLQAMVIALNAAIGQEIDRNELLDETK